jgi:UDP:flavonoid glycosyltransferase YjiC (YdhE family)
MPIRRLSTSGSAVVFAMPEQGHFKRLLPLIAGLAGAGMPTLVLTDLRFREQVERAGGQFVDLFMEHPIEHADATSIPIPCRYVSFAGRYADDIVRKLAPLQPAIIVHDTFAVIGAAVANHLVVPRVNVCAGHNLAPEPTVETLRHDPRVRLSAACWDAVRTLRKCHGMPDASPFSYVTALSPDLNVYCEPPEFLRPAERKPFEPLVFFGSLPDEETAGEMTAASPFGEHGPAQLRIYASFGTVVWRYYQAEAFDALDALSDVLSEMPNASALVSLGGGGSSKRATRLARPNVRVVSYAEQWAALRDASVYLTHQGLNSTHEAIFHGTPMISYPFFADQPGLAQRCRELGLAVPLVDAVRGPVGPSDVRSALARVATEREAMRARLAEARSWEIETIRARPEVIRRIINLIR